MAEVRMALGSSPYGVTYLDVREHPRPDPVIVAISPSVAPLAGNIVIIGYNFTSNPDLVSVQMCPYDYDWGFQYDDPHCRAAVIHSISDRRISVRLPLWMRTIDNNVVVKVIGAQRRAHMAMVILGHN
jgi:hypothetical protein